MHDSTTPLEAALEYVARSWYVVPLHTPVPASKIDPSGCDCHREHEQRDVGKHPRTRNGYKDASNDPDQIRKWFGSLWPTANIGIALERSGLIDVAPDSIEWAQEFKVRGLPRTLMFASGGGDGHFHCLYRRPDGVRITRKCLPDKYDILSDGYAVMPPSLHRSSLSYLWFSDESNGGSLIDAPDWVCHLLNDPKAERPVSSERGDVIRDEAFNHLLGSVDLRVWNGETGLDRSRGLVAIAGELAQAGANEATIIFWLRERDEALGWRKYSDRDDADVRYEEISAEAVGRAAREPMRVGIATARAEAAAYAASVNGQTAGPGPSAVAADFWPDPIGEDAYHGPLGEVVRAIQPKSEADAATLFAHAIVIAGGWIGARVHGFAGDMPHPARFMAGVVGDTSKARKGTGAAPFRRTQQFSEEPKIRFAKGLSSAEGLIHQVRDEVWKYNQKSGVDEMTDPGVSDKRLVVIESELASLLRRMEREGNAISAVMREAFDYGDLETLVKINPSRSTGAHINLVAHITEEELAAYLHPTEVASGFANRILWFAVRRGQYIPRGGRTDEVPLIAFAEALDETRRWSVGLPDDGLLEWSDEAGRHWDSIYHDLSSPTPGLYGQATQRSEALVFRMTVLYAALDRSPLLELPHLMAALEVWRFCDESARKLFGARTGNPIADTIIDALRANGELTQTQVSGLFGNNMQRNRIQVALQILLKYRLVRTFTRGSAQAKTIYWAAI